MHVAALLLVAALSVAPGLPQAPAIDFAAATEEAALTVVAEDIGVELVWVQERDPETGQFVSAEDSEERGYWTMMYGNSYDPAVLAFIAASAFEMYTASDLRNQCDASEIITCSDPFPNTVTQDALITAGVYAGVTALQRLAKTQWDIDMDEGWKNVLVWGGIAAVRSLIAAQNMSDANALRELGY